MLKLILMKLRKAKIMRDQGGFTLIEAVIGIGLLVIVGVAVLVGISTAFKASATTDKISTALALAQSQIESIEAQEYACDSVDGIADGNATYTVISSIPNYSISVSAISINANTGEVQIPDAGLQKITVIVTQLNNPDPVTLVAYKVKPTAEACP
jgi:type II secretory pathway pseudopilin PulG